MEHLPLSKLLLQGRFLTTQEEADAIANEAKEKSMGFLTAFFKQKKIEQAAVANFLAQKFHVPYLDVEWFNLEEVPAEIDLNVIEKFWFLPIKKTANTLFIVVSDPTVRHINDIKFQTNIANINLIITEDNKLNKVIKSYFDLKGKVLNDWGQDTFKELAVENEDTLYAASEVEDAPVVKFVQEVLIAGINQKASDIHFEPYEKSYRVRFRIDGVLSEYKKIATGLREKIASRIKVISSLDISEKRVPQDGRFKLKLSSENSVDFRVSTLPTLFGEKIVLRILDSSPAMLNIDSLGYTEDQKRLILDAISKPYGMVLVTGPTGSGKTISLYTCLGILNNDDKNISTAEDPAEINMHGINQVNINEKAGLNFATALRSFLRQDPDVILVGEIRDLETADVAIKASQTGHLVLSTLHTNNAPQTLTRLLNMGVKPFNIASSVSLVTAQRLIRKLCNCKQEESIPIDVLLEAGFNPDDLAGYGKKWTTYKAVGCMECDGTGYKGRVGIYQVLPMSEGIKKIILSGGNDLDITLEAKNMGVLDLREAGLIKVKNGITSLIEVLANTNN